MVLFGCYNVAHVGAMWRRAGRQRAVAGEGMPGETAGERRRGRRYGADVPTRTGPDFVLASGAQVAPTCGAVAGGHRRAGDARANGRRRGDVVPGPTKPVQPLTAPRRRAPSRTCNPPQRPRNPPPTEPSRQRPGSPLVADAMPVDPTCKPRPGSRRSRERRPVHNSHSRTRPLVIPAFAGIQGRGRVVCLPPPCSPPTLPLQGRRASDGQQTNPLFVPLPASKAATKKQ